MENKVSQDHSGARTAISKWMFSKSAIVVLGTIIGATVGLLLSGLLFVSIYGAACGAFISLAIARNWVRSFSWQILAGAGLGALAGPLITGFMKSAFEGTWLGALAGFFFALLWEADSNVNEEKWPK